MAGRSPGPSNLLALSFALLAGACSSETIALGSECPAFALECSDDPDADGADADPDGVEPDDDGAIPTDDDAAIPTDDDDSGELDAGVPVDAGLEPVFPPIQNGGFQITSDPPVPGEVSPISGTSIDPWQWCGGSIDVGPELDGYTPTEGDTLISLAFGVGTTRLGQRLAMPLEADQPYAMAVDLARSENGGELRLELIGSDDCTGGDKLAESPALVADTDAGLVTYCLAFTPTKSYPSLILSTGAFSVIGKVYVDNMRFDASCAQDR